LYVVDSSVVQLEDFQMAFMLLIRREG